MKETLPLTRTVKSSRFVFKRFLLICVFILLLASILTGYFIFSNIKPPADFPLNTVISVKPGMSVAKITKFLAEKRVVQSETLLYGVLLTQYDSTQIKASDYIFTEPLDVFAVAKRLTEGDYDSTLINFIHKEGERVSAIANNASLVLENFDRALFIEQALPYEGKLFPDTYRIPPDFTGDDLIALMNNRYEESILPLRPLMIKRQLTEDQVIILASIIEREANSPESMKMVSGILQNRLKIMMPLQADASIEYILNKPLGKLTAADLKIDSPYNTYTNFGLPPTAIGNPGLEAIKAVLEPTESDYYYYITDNDGNFHYAKTFSEHKANVARYLR